jgi:hypothetical protein
MNANITTETLDTLFDNGKENILPYFDTGNIMTWEEFSTQHTLSMIEHVDVDMPHWLVQALDLEATQLNISRQAVIKTWLAEKARALGRGPSVSAT